MKFTNLPWLTGVLLLCLSGCSSFSTDVEDKNTAAPNTNTLNTPAPSTDPWQNKAQPLKALPNRYHNQAEKQDINPQLSSRFAQGLLLLKQHKLPEAQNLYLSLAEQYPQMSGIWLQLASIQASQKLAASDIQLQQQLLDMQIRYLNNAIQANPDNYIAHNQLALLLRQQGLFSQALNHFDLALSSWPAFPEARLNRAILNDLYLGNKKAALEDYQLYQALVTQPNRQLKGWIIDLERQIKLQEQSYNSTSGSIKGASQ